METLRRICPERIAVILFLLLRYYCNESFAQPRQGDNVCVFDGRIFQPGESFGELFEIPRCGAWFDFPCFCNLNFDPPIECPYCAIVVQNDGLVCARQDETVSVLNGDGELQECECLKTDASGESRLQATCRDSAATNPPVGDDTIGGDDDDEVDLTDVCTIDVDGATQTFQNGESFGTALQTRCIDALEYPCFCDTDLPTKIRCPYCGYPTVTGELACAQINETIQFTGAANEPTECTCLDDTSSSSECRDLSAPTPFPTGTIPVTAAPTISPTTSPITPAPSTPAPTKPTAATPRPSISFSPSMAPAPTTPWPSAGFDKPSVFKPNRNPVAVPTSPKPSPDGCFFNRKSDNSLGFVENGRAFGDDVVGPCPFDDFPVVCNTRLTGKREYPYCVFSSFLQQDDTITISNAEQGTNTITETTCAASGNRVLVSRQDGAKELCGCLYNNPAIGPVSQCKMVDFNYTEVLPTAMPTRSPTTFDDNPSGNAGPSNEPPTSSSYSVRCGLSIVLSTLCSVSMLIRTLSS